jgi:hypothetical protein
MYATPQCKRAPTTPKPKAGARKVSGPLSKHVVVQTRLTVNQPGDEYEQEADRVADSVMRMPESYIVGETPRNDCATDLADVGSRHVQRACAACEDELLQRRAADEIAGQTAGEERTIQTLSHPGAMVWRQSIAEEEESVQAKAAIPSRAAHRVTGRDAALILQVKRGPAHTLPASVRQFMEPRFGHDFGRVRLHTDARASESARAVGARAYTLGSHVVFGQGQFQPSTERGRRLIAHELTHVVQQRRGAEPMLRRTLTASSSCPAGVHDAPADPITELAADDQRAQLMALGSFNVLSFEALLFDDPTFGRSDVSDAYERRFGLPPAASRGRFRNRFTGRTYATQNEAMREEMLSLSTRYRQLNEFLSGPIRYRCPGVSSVTLPGCAAARCRTSIAFSCPGGRQIAICPAFWTHPDMQTVDQRGGNMIHEAVHMRLRFRGHGLANANQRGRNAECYAAFVADVYGFHSDDSTDCTPLIA